MSTSHRVKALFKVVTIALVMAVCSFAKSTHDQPRNSDAALLVSGNPPAAIKLKEEEIRQHDDWWSVDIKYPQAEGADVFNMAVRRNLTATIEDFRKGLPKSATTGYPDYGGYLKGTYAAQVLKSGVISVLLSYEEYAPGAAHPGGIMASVDYDARVQRVLALSDLFLPQSDYVSRLSALAIDSLDHHEYAVPDMIRRGAGPVESNFKVFTLTDDALVLHFQQYQVAAGAAPSEQVVIPLTALAPLLQKEYRPVR